MFRSIGGTFVSAAALALVALTSLQNCFAQADSKSLSMLTTDATRIVDASGNTVILKGCNLGNDLMLESWMLGGCIQQNGQPYEDQAQLFRAFQQKFGEDKYQQLMRTYRDGYVTPRDFELIKSFGFNAVRLPFDYRLIQDDASPPKFRDNAFEWIDHVLEQAEAAKVYVILDLHGTPGGQSREHHTGAAGQNHLWDSEPNKQRTVEIWKALAERYKNRSIVAAYDLINEPYGDYKTDYRPQLAQLMPRIAKAIRATGDQHIIFFAGALNGGIAFYGNPHDQGLTNIGFTEHYYPGLFGSKSALETQARTLNLELPAKAAYLKQVGAPYFVGEFNIVLQPEDPERIMRAYYDRFAEYGWAATMWSYKLVKPEAGAGPSAWYMVSNGESLPKLDLDNSSFDDFEKFFASFATMPLAANETLRAMMTAKTPRPLYLAKFEPLPTARPSTPESAPDGYSSTDLGGAVPGHTAIDSDGKLTIFGGGTDINANADAFRFVSKSATGDSEIRATFTALLQSSEWAKGGVMARFGEAAATRAGGPMAMVNVFPDGSVAMMSRTAENGPTTESKHVTGSLPMEVRLQISAGHAVGSYRADRGDWQTIDTADVSTARAYRTGLAVCAHADAVLTRAVALLGDRADAALPAVGAASDHQDSASSALLKNGSFEKVGAQTDVAADWNRWGDWMNFEAAWSPTHGGKGLIGYHHWQIESSNNSGLWQDVPATPGARYTFSIFAQRDPVTGDQHEAQTVELRLESVTPDGELTLNTQNFDGPKLATGKQWSKLSISGTAASDKLRVLVVISPAAQAPRGGSIKLDDASLAVADEHPSSAAGAAAPGPQAAGAQAADDETTIPADAVVQRDIVYETLADQTQVKLDLIRPAGDGPFPLVIWIHGGAWKLGEKGLWPHMNFAAGHGFAVANLDYRLSQVAPFPAQIDDCAAALDFLSQHASQFHLDAERFAVSGESAGGHLAALLALRAGNARIRAVIDLAGPSDLMALTQGRDANDAINQLLGGPIDQKISLAREASPINHVSKNAPPFLLMHGGADPLVPVAQSTSLADALHTAGVSAEVFIAPGVGHVGPVFWTPAMQQKLIAFLRAAQPATPKA